MTPQFQIDYDRVARAITFLRKNRPDQPVLADVAAHVHFSPFHFERLFIRWAGVSPKKFLQHLTREVALEQLARGASVLDAAHASGLSGPGRLHDLLIEWDGMTPGEWKRRGDGMEIEYGEHPSPFGWCLLGLTPRGICALHFVDAPGSGAERIGRDFPNARLSENHKKTAALAGRIFRERAPGHGPLRLHLRGTKFQFAVWRALLAIPLGVAASYGAIARLVGRDRAGRAVGTAVGSNPVAFLIPCHRVLRADGSLGGYRWSPERKATILAWEQGQDAGRISASANRAFEASRA